MEEAGLLSEVDLGVPWESPPQTVPQLNGASPSSAFLMFAAWEADTRDSTVNVRGGRKIRNKAIAVYPTVTRATFAYQS